MTPSPFDLIRRALGPVTPDPEHGEDCAIFDPLVEGMECDCSASWTREAVRELEKVERELAVLKEIADAAVEWSITTSDFGEWSLKVDRLARLCDRYRAALTPSTDR